MKQTKIKLFFFCQQRFVSISSMCAIRFTECTLPDTNNSYGAFSQELITTLNFGSFFPYQLVQNETKRKKQAAKFRDLQREIGGVFGVPEGSTRNLVFSS